MGDAAAVLIFYAACLLVVSHRVLENPRLEMLIEGVGRTTIRT